MLFLLFMLFMLCFVREKATSASIIFHATKIQLFFQICKYLRKYMQKRKQEVEKNSKIVSSVRKKVRLFVAYVRIFS